MKTYLFQHNSYIYNLQQMLVHVSHRSTPFRKGLFNLFAFCDSSPQLVKNFNICRHNVYEHVSMSGTQSINVIYITFGVNTS